MRLHEPHVASYATHQEPPQRCTCANSASTAALQVVHAGKCTVCSVAHAAHTLCHYMLSFDKVTTPFRRC